MKKITFALLLLSGPVSAQLNTDSLWLIYRGAKATDNERAWALYWLFDNNAMVLDQDSARGYALELLAFGRELKEPVLEADALITLGALFNEAGASDSGLAYLDRARTILKTENNPRELAKVWMNKGLVMLRMGRQDSAQLLFQRTLELARPLNARRMEAGTLCNIGNVYFTTGDIARAIAYYTQALQGMEVLGDSAWMGNTVGNIGNCYATNKDLERAEPYFKRAAVIFEGIGDRGGQAWCLVNLGLVYTERKQFEDARTIFERSLNIARDIGHTPLLIRALVQLGTNHRLTGRPDSAEYFYDQGLKVGEPMHERFNASEALLGKAEIAAGRGRLNDAIDLSRKALAYGQELHSSAIISNASKGLYSYLKKRGDLAEAMEMLELSVQMADSLKKEENTSEVVRQELKYNYEKEALADSLAHAEEQRRMELEAQAKLALERNHRNIFLFSGIGVLLVAGGLWNRLRFTRRARTEADRLRQRAEASERFKQQFLANMSHEIRTPMNAIMGMTGILKRNERLPEQEKYLSAISQSSENLLVILNDILDLSKLEAGKIDLEQVAFDPRQVIGNVRDILRFKAEEKGIALVIDLAENVPASLLGDPTRLNQIVLNIAGNAVKFTQEGSVTMRTRWTDGKLMIDILDTGIGIPDDRLDKIFEEFTQAYSDTTRKYGGTGLGLTISKRLAELQGGSITVRSEQGKGSTFTVMIPYAIADQQVARATDDQQPTSDNLKDLRILLAEDNDFNAMVAQDELADAIPGVHVEIAANGRIAVEMVQANNYDVVLMDVQMPEMNGYDATTAIRALPGDKSRTPIVAMTANVMKEEVERCKEAGMDGYVPKPFKREELMSALRMVIGT